VCVGIGHINLERVPAPGQSFRSAGGLLIIPTKRSVHWFWQEDRVGKLRGQTGSPMSISRLRDGQFLDVNEACCRLWGYSREEFLGHDASQLRLWYNPADREQFFKMFRSTGSVRDFEIVIRTRRDAQRTVLFSAERVEVGGEHCMVASIYDITATREAERIQQQVELQLRQTQKLEALGTLAGGIAHDFNNILTTIVAATELVELDSEYPDMIGGHISEIRVACSRAQALVRQILTFGRRHEHERKTFDMRDVVTDSLDLLRRALPSSVDIQCHVDQSPVLVNADPNQIQQILMNLGTNAAHAMRSRAGALTVSVDKTFVNEAQVLTVSSLEPGWYARIVVEDRGEGMDETTVARLFEPFFTTKKVGEGTGLGLAVVHGIIREHDGALDVLSRRGDGTRMSVYLPLYEGQFREDKEPKSSITPGARGERVLFVDDEKAVGRACGNLLMRAGYKVSIFDSPVDALKHFSEACGDFDLVITDLAMPHMNGDQFAQAVLALRPDIPILMITGYGAGLTRQNVRSLGAFDLLQKPITRQSLTAAVRRALDGTQDDERLSVPWRQNRKINAVRFPASNDELQT
jgi:PAS domain S-box-containing protein